MTVFVPSTSAMEQLARLTGRSPNDPAVRELFDQLVLRGHLVPFVPGWWEQIRWGEVERIARG
jgi:hypothetical protein